MSSPHSESPRCAFCDSRRTDEIMDFGRVALAGGFLTRQQFDAEKKFMLRLHFCNDCYAVQVVDRVPPDVLFHNYFYFSSSIGTLREHFQRYAAEMASRFLEPSRAAVLEIGCNDGVLLRPLADQGIRTVIGVDPAANVVSTIDDRRLTLVNDFFTEAVARRLVDEVGRVDMIMANNVYAHISDIQGTTRAVAHLLNDEGVFVFEVHYLGKVIHEMQYDMIYHEHLYYYSLLSAMKHLERYGMMVFDVAFTPIHGGSIRVYACKRGSGRGASATDAVKALEQKEREGGFDRFETFRNFSRRVAEHRAELVGLLDRLRREGRRIAGYGASGRANTMIQYCGISHDHLEYLIDDAPAKTGFYTPGSHFRIHSSDVLEKPDAPDYVLVFAWAFVDEIRKRIASYLARGGRMILPLPRVAIVPGAQA